MNRTYKVIWSKARRCYVVVSELAKGQHKSSSKSEHISLNVHRGGYLGKAALAAVVASLLTFGGMAYSPVMAAESVTDTDNNTITSTDSKKATELNANITGKNNKVTDSSNAEIVGDTNTVTNKAVGEDGSVRYVRSNDARIHGSGNTISASRNQQVIGDNNTIMGRDDGTVTDYQHPEGREPNVSDLTIGRGNFIRSTDTYRNEWDSLKVIGNNNRADMKIESAGGPAAGIVIGDNQNIDNIKDSIVIGSLSPNEQKEQVGEDGYKSDKYTVGLNSVVVGYHATSSKDASTVIGNRSKVSGNYQTVTGLRSTIEGNYYNSLNLLDGQSGNFASIYGSFNKIEDASGEDDMDGVGNSINGSMNVTSNARGTMIMGVGNTVTHSKGEFLFPKDDDSSISTGDLLYVGASAANDYALGRDITGDNLTYPADQVYAYMRDAWQRYMETSGGAVSVLGNSNTSDYAIRSQILGTNNILKGAEDNISSYNTISGFSNTGTNVKRTAIVGTGNNLTNGVDNVVIGDYHTLENGKHNVILGSMASEEKAVTKTAKAAWAATDDNPDGTYTYTVNEQVALKPNTKDIENAVMVGYNTDATVDGGVALGSDSIASTEAGKTGYDAQGKKHAKSDNDYATWVSTDAAVSVGRAEEKDEKTGKVTSNAITRQITNLAAGTQDTDAVNVAQLKASEANINTTINNVDKKVAVVDKKVAVIFDDKGSLMSTDARMTHDIGSEGQSIALGKGAHAWMQAGSKANMILFGMQKAAGAIAIGEGAEALSQSINIGNRTYTGDIGDVTISKYGNSGSGSGVGSVLLGTNSYTGGTFSTLIGDYSIMSTVYPNGYTKEKDKYSSDYTSFMQNAGAVSVGALNSIESATSSNDYSGVANSIVGLANKTNNANGALIYGAGNTIKNSFADVATPGYANSAAEAAQSFRESVQNNPGGAALAIGGGNAIDRSIRSQVIGVNNKLTGNLYHEDKWFGPDINEYSTQYNMIDGYNNQVANVNHAYVIGANNIIQGKKFSDATKDGVLSKADRDKAKKDDNLIVIGDNHTLANDVTNDIILGSADKTLKTSVSNVVMIGHNADAQKEGSVALGADSVASTKEGIAGFDPQSRKHVNSDKDYSTWVSTDAAVSVGGADREVKYKDKEGKEQVQIVKSTRQITNVAAGMQDTDAVNVAQLKAISSTMNTDIAASKTHFYSVKSTDATARNYNNDGATAANALAAGVGANADKASAVAIGDTAYAGSANGVAIGTGSWIRSSDGNKPNANGGDVAIGQDSHVDSYVNQGGSIALGQNARVENMHGNTEKSWAFGQTEFVGADNIPVNPGNEAGGVAIGRNSFARTGSLMVGSHMYKGAIADMDEVDGTDSQKLRENFNNINMTTLGTNSFNSGTFATVTGSYSATTAKKKTQNFAATVNGSLNSIESYKDAADNSGVASSIVGTANRIANSNNTTILGAGNEVTNSLTDFTAPTEGGASAKALQDTLKNTLQNDAKGAVVISGIGNKIDSSHGVSVLGSKNVVDATDNIQLLGDNREVKGANGSVIIGSADSKTTTSVKDATILGHNANASVEGGVALGAGSVASREAQKAGYDPSTKEASKDTSAVWKATNAAVSVGKADGSMTRQITGVAAGTELTDAVNVAQLQKALAGAKDGNDTLKSSTDALKLDGNKLSMNIQDTAGHTVSGSVDLSKLAQAVDTNTTYTFNSQENKDNTTTITVKDSNGKENSVTVATKDTRNTVKAGENVTLDTKDNADGSHEYTVNVKADGKVEAGSTKIVSGGTVYNETRVVKDGTFVKQANTAGENLLALDNQVTANTESIYHINNRVSDLDNRVNKVGAGAAALAALHPLDFDPDDKWDFAVGYGNYRNANSVAFGAFYRPNEDTMFSLGTNFGNGENMFNAGLSFKIGQGGSGITTSKTAMAKTISSLKDTVHKQDQKIEGLENVVDTQDKKIAELEALVKEQGEMIRQYVGKK